ncbi:MAG: Gfo/Idh/MocA family oxidoreductase [Acidimicrobiales bacterium]
MGSNNSSTFRLGLVGAGRMGQTHLRALSDSADVAIVAVAEPIDALREKVENEYSVKGYLSLDDLLDAGEIDGALIVTPSDTHVGVIAKVAAANLPILCEKPCGVSPEDTRRAQHIVADARVPLQIAYWRRFVPELQMLRERIARRDFGEILSVSCLQWDGAPPAASFRTRSGGIFVDMGVHEFDQARWLTSSDFTQLSAVASSVVTDPESGGDPDSAQVLCATSSGATVLVSLGRWYAGGDMASVEIFGTYDHVASVFLDPLEGEAVQLDALRHQASSFADFVRGGPCLGATVEDAIAALGAAANAAAQLSTQQG